MLNYLLHENPSVSEIWIDVILYVDRVKDSKIISFLYLRKTSKTEIHPYVPTYVRTYQIKVIKYAWIFKQWLDCQVTRSQVTINH